MRCRFMELLPHFLGGQREKRLREKALTILQHLTSNVEHANLLLKHNIVILIVQDLVAQPNHSESRISPRVPDQPLVSPAGRGNFTKRNFCAASRSCFRACLSSCM